MESYNTFSSGKYNGSTGIVKDILFSQNIENRPPDTLPLSIVVEFPSYSGPPYFDNVHDPTSNELLEDRSKWVPIKAETVQWYRNTGRGSRETMERTSFPICLSWAWTPCLERTRYNQF